MVLLGIAVRVSAYATFRSFWMDESDLALNIVHRPMGQLLFAPLDYMQGAPLLFLFFAKLFGLMFGYHEAALRLAPFLGGIASIFLFAWILNRFIGKIGTLVGLGLFVLSGGLIYYASELKQYSTDVMAGLILLALTLYFVERPLETRHFIWLAVAGIVMGALSHPALFMLIGAGGVLFMKALLDTPIGFRMRGKVVSILGIRSMDSPALSPAPDYRTLWKLLAVWGVWLVFYVGLYFVSLRALSINNGLLSYWSGLFMPLPPWSNLSWFNSSVGALLLILLPPAWFPRILLGLLAAVAWFSLFRRNPWLGLFIPLVFMASLAASALHKYPFGDRMILFLYPLVFLLAAELFQRIFELLRRFQQPPIALGLTGLTVLLAFGGYAANGFNLLGHPLLKEEYKAVYQYYLDHKVAGDRMYLYSSARRAYAYYRDVYGFDPENVIIGGEYRDAPEKYTQEIAPMFQLDEPIWFLLSHPCPYCEIDEEEYIAAYFQQNCALTDEYHAEGAAVYRFVDCVRGSTMRSVIPMP